jgi:hypothetical protein
VRHVVSHTLQGRSCKVERKRKQRYSKEFKTQAIERMNTCDNISRLNGRAKVAWDVRKPQADCANHARRQSPGISGRAP